MIYKRFYKKSMNVFYLALNFLKSSSTKLTELTKRKSHRGRYIIDEK